MNVAIKQVPELKPVPLAPMPRLHPRIVLSKCWQCGGAGRSVIRYLGRIREDQCSQCNGRGTLVSEG